MKGRGIGLWGIETKIKDGGGGRMVGEKIIDRTLRSF